VVRPHDGSDLTAAMRHDVRTAVPELTLYSASISATDILCVALVLDKWNATDDV